MSEDLVGNSICLFAVASYLAMIGPQVCSMLGAPQVAEVLPNGARFELQATHVMSERFGAISARVVLSGARWTTRLLGVGLIVFLDGVKAYREGIT